MAKRVTQEDIKKFNQLYYELHTYAAVARETGFSSSTVAKYIDKSYTPIDEAKIIHFEGDLPEFEFTEMMLDAEHFGRLGKLKEKEKEDMIQLWKELEL